MVRSIVPSILLSLAACSTVVPYQPSPNMIRAEAEKVIVRAFEEQPANYRPRQIVIDDDAIRLSSERLVQGFWTGAVAVVDRNDVFYYSSLERPRFLKRNRYFKVLLSNRDGTVKRWVIFYDEQRAKQFLDALSSLAGQHRGDTD